MKSKLFEVLAWFRDHFFFLVSLTVKLVIGKKEETNKAIGTPTNQGEEPEKEINERRN